MNKNKCEKKLSQHCEKALWSKSKETHTHKYAHIHSVGRALQALYVLHGMTIQQSMNRVLQFKTKKRAIQAAWGLGYLQQQIIFQVL